MSGNGSRDEFHRHNLLSCSTFLSLVISASFVLAFVIVSVPLYFAVQEGHGGLALELQKVSSASVLKLLETRVVATETHLAALSTLLGREPPGDNALVWPSSGRFQGLLYSSSQTAHAGVLAGFPDGRVTGYLGAFSQSLLFVNSSSADGGKLSLATFNTELWGVPGSANRTVLGYDVRREWWYTAAAQHDATSSASTDRTLWSAIEVHPGLQCLGITASRPLFVDTKLVAVLAVHLPLAMLNEVLGGAKIGRTGEVFVFDGSGNVVGMSNRTRLSSACNVLLHAKSQQDQVFVDLVIHLLSISGGRFDSIPSIEARNLYLAGRDFALTTYVVASDELRWTGAMIVPHSDHFRRPDAYFRNSLIIAGVVVIALSIAMMRFTSLLYTHPLLELADAMDRVGKTLTTADIRDSRSIIHEVLAIEHSYKRMAAALQAMGKYVPVPVVQQLVRDAGRTETMVSTRECTFLFADIVGFTTLSETIAPRQLHAQLTEYFGATEDILTDLKGIATDLLGDGFFVFWNAPCNEPDHAALACEAALRMKERLKVMQGDWTVRGMPVFRVRIGINTGTCLVSSFGSSHHLKYTAMGDAVNVASRLEQLNKHYKTDIIIGEATLARVGSTFLARPLDVVVLLGKTAPTKVYSLLCRRETASNAQLFLAEQSELLQDAFIDKNFEKAKDVAKNILHHFPDDFATQLLLERSCSLEGRRSPRVVVTK
jgi:adenylate cyclase